VDRALVRDDVVRDAVLVRVAGRPARRDEQEQGVRRSVGEVQGEGADLAGLARVRDVVMATGARYSPTR
jgi:hypothetical protein